MVSGSVYRRSRETDHWQVDTLCPDGKVWPIDMLMYPLLGKLWDEGVATWVCCAGVTLVEYQERHGGLPWPGHDKRRGAHNCYLGIIGDPYAAATLLVSWGLPPMKIRDDDWVTEHWAQRGQLSRNALDLDILAFRAWCAERGVADHP